MIVLSNRDIAALLPMADAIAVVERAMVEVSTGRATLPLRTIMELGEGNRMGMMPGALADPAAFGMKLISLFPGNPAAGYSSHEGAMVLFEARHGAAIGMMNAGLLTALRTAAASAVATRALARPDSSVLAIVGTGEQAGHHLDAMLSVRDIAELRVVGRRAERAEAFAGQAREKYPHLAVSHGVDVERAVKEADLVCTVTNATEPILKGEWIAPGAHLNVVGSSIPSMREIDEEIVARAAIFVDYRASTFAQAGEIIAALRSGRIGEDHIRAEIGEVLAGTRPGRSSTEEITLYRSLGIAAQDIACAHHCVMVAEKRGIGVRAALD